jgi:hypothetical protein
MAHPYNKHARVRAEKRKLKALYECRPKGYFPSGAYFDEEKGRIIRYYRSSLWGYLRGKASRRVRRLPIGSEDAELPQHGGYKRYFDVAWEYD